MKANLVKIGKSLFRFSLSVCPPKETKIKGRQFGETQFDQNYEKSSPFLHFPFLSHKKTKGKGIWRSVSLEYFSAPRFWHQIFNFKRKFKSNHENLTMKFFLVWNFIYHSEHHNLVHEEVKSSHYENLSKISKVNLVYDAASLFMIKTSF